MSQIVVDFYSINLARKFAAAKERQMEQMPDQIAPVVERYMKKLHKAARVYPPPIPNGKYIRTYKLRRSWRVGKVSMSDNEISGSVYSDGSARNKYGEDYAPRVMDAAHQATIHQGRWHTTKSMAEDVKQPFVKSIVRAARKLIKTPVAL